MRGILIIMAKRPLSGTVKTRLCPPLSADEALALYHAFLLDTIALVDAAARLAGNVTPAIAYTPADAGDYFRELAPANFVLLPQTGADLGERLSDLPQQARQLGFNAAAMISSDSPTLSPTLVAGAFTALQRPGVDAVLGPCSDGGYYMIALNEPQEALFSGISWSTSLVTTQTLDAAKRAGLHMTLLPEWPDVDTADDLPVLRAALAADPALARHTRTALAAIHLPV